MLAASGVDPPFGPDGKTGEILIGPGAVLYGPVNNTSSPSTWSFIEPSGESLNFLSKDIEHTIRELRELGKQPLTSQSGNLTVITTAFAAIKVNNILQAWVVRLQDGLMRALQYIGLWLSREITAEIEVHRDFDTHLENDDVPTLVSLALGDFPLLSRDGLLNELKRRGVLGPKFDPEEDLALIGPRDDDDGGDE